MVAAKTIAKNNSYKVVSINNYFEYLPITNKRLNTKHKHAKLDLCDIDTQSYMVILELTRSCPLGCKYCFISEINSKERLKLKSNTKQNISNLINQLSQTKYNYSICFHGGEPLLKKGLIKHTIAAVKKAKLSKTVVFGVQTSGYGLDLDFVKFAQKNNLSIGVSIDSITPAFRNSSVGFKALDLLRAKGVKPGIICLINKSNQDKLFNLFKFLVKNYDIKGILFNAIYHSDEQKLPDLRVVKTQIKKIINYSLKNCLPVSIDPLKMFSERIVGQFSSLCYDSGCGGFKRIFAYSVDGKFYPCDTFVDNPNYALEHLYVPEFLKVRQKILGKVKKTQTDLGCDSCKYNFICKKPCVGKLSVFENPKLSAFVCQYEKLWLNLYFKYILKNPVNIKYFKGDLRNIENQLDYLFPESRFIVQNFKKGC